MQLATTAFAHFPVALDWRGLDIAHRLAIVYRRFCDRFGDIDTPVSLEDLANEPETCDLDESQIREHSGRAKQLLLAEGAAEPTYDRESRVQLGSALILGLMPAIATCHTTLREGGFTNAELGTLWDEIVARAADIFHADRAPHKPAAPSIGMPAFAYRDLARNAE